jgi:acetyl esterase/lipase
MESELHDYRPGGQSAQARITYALSRIFVRPTLALWPLSGPLAPWMAIPDQLFKRMPRHPRTEFTAIETDTWRGELVKPRGVSGMDSALLYFHGGAFVFCGLGTHRRIVERLALRTGRPVLAVEYRKLPKALLRDSLDDALSAFRWLTARGVDRKSIVCIGDSAGGHLAFALALKLRELGEETIAGVVGLSPWLDFDHEAKRMHVNATRDAFVPYARLSVMARKCVGNEQIDPALSPVNAALEGLPPVLIQCAEDEVLRHDAELMAQRLRSAGVETTLQIWQGQVHAFPVLANALPDSRAALEEIVAFVRAQDRA